MLGGKCFRCGFMGDPCLFDFHHKTGNKEFAIGCVTNKSWNSVKAEVLKCELLCVMCHRREHSDAHSLAFLEAVRNYGSHMHPPVKLKKCSQCGVVFKPSQARGKYCSKNCAYVKVKELSVKPSKDVLAKLAQTVPMTKVARHFNVCDKTVKKWCKSYGIINPGRGFWLQSGNSSYDTKACFSGIKKGL